MAEQYKLYVIARTGGILKRTDLACVDDEDAMKHARQLLNGMAIEVWHSERRIGLIEPDK